MLTFAEIKAIIGSELPRVARSHVKWWDNTPDTIEHDERLKTGQKLVMTDFESRKVKFK
jgi:hypothetical protein